MTEFKPKVQGEKTHVRHGFSAPDSHPSVTAMQRAKTTIVDHFRSNPSLPEHLVTQFNNLTDRSLDEGYATAECLP